MNDQTRPPLPPFTPETAAQKARAAEDAWNTRDPARVSLAYTPDSRWRNRTEFLQSREAIRAFPEQSHADRNSRSEKIARSSNKLERADRLRSA